MPGTAQVGGVERAAVGVMKLRPDAGQQPAALAPVQAQATAVHAAAGICGFAKAVHGAAGETTELARILDGVVDAIRAGLGVGRAPLVAQVVAGQAVELDVRVHAGKAQADGVGQTDRVGQQGVLATHGHGAPVTGQAEHGGAVKKARCHADGADIHAQGGLEVEGGAQATAQVFTAANAPAAGRAHAAVD